jgi:two-component system, OmpR family, response regulator
MNALHHVLCVDDDDDILEMIKFSLELDPGIRVTCCNNALAALERIADETPDLVLLDVMMPDMDGPATLMAMRKTETGRCVPVIFLTARARPHEIQSYLMAGALGTLNKPFNPMTLVQDIHKLVEQTDHSCAKESGSWPAVN